MIRLHHVTPNRSTPRSRSPWPHDPVSSTNSGPRSNCVTSAIELSRHMSKARDSLSHRANLVRATDPSRLLYRATELGSETKYASLGNHDYVGLVSRLRFHVLLKPQGDVREELYSLEFDSVAGSGVCCSHVPFPLQLLGWFEVHGLASHFSRRIASTTPE